MRIGGIQKVSLIDYPGQISAVIFTQGCNFRCPYCHNPELVNPKLWGTSIPTGEILGFLDRRVGKLDAVVITGGEPLIHDDLPSFMAQVKERGFLVKLDTNGYFPDRLAHVIQRGLLDYVAMDAKAPWSSYDHIVHVPVDMARLEESVSLICSSSLDYEFRVTVVYPLLTDNDILNIGRQLMGAKRLVLQKFRPVPHIDTGVEGLYPPTDQELILLKKKLEEIIPSVIVRS